MRALFVLILVGAVAYLGWFFHPQLLEWAHTHLPAFQATVEATPEPATPPPSTPEPPQIAPPGTFYMVERVTRETESGVKALLPGTEVKLMYRKKDGTLLVTDGQYEFYVSPASVTQDRTAAARAMFRK